VNGPRDVRNMTLCPIALAVHCTGCPLVKVCPAKGVLGDYETCVPAPVASESDAKPDPHARPRRSIAAREGPGPTPPAAYNQALRLAELPG